MLYTYTDTLDSSQLIAHLALALLDYDLEHRLDEFDDDYLAMAEGVMKAISFADPSI